MKLSFKERLFIVSLKSLGQLSLKNIYYLVKIIYFILRPIPMRLKKTIHINLSRCLPMLSQKELKRLEQKVFFHTLMRVAEMPFFWFAPLTQVAKLQWEIHGEAAFKKTFSAGNGVIVLVPHLGAWEGVNYYMGHNNYPSVSLYKPRKKAYQELLIKIARERFNVQMFPTNITGIKNLFYSLHSGKCVGILSDHDPGDNGGCFVPFFGIPANTTTLIKKLADKSQAALFFIIAERLDRAKGFRIHFIAADPAISAPSPEDAAAALNAQTAEIIKRFPAQYEWSYKRFRRTLWQDKGFYDA